MKVKSKPGTKCPMEGKPRKYIEDAGFVTVPDTAYYKRLVRDGSLVMGKAPVLRQKATQGTPSEASAKQGKEKPKAQKK